jgi:hypothetical protein
MSDPHAASYIEFEKRLASAQAAHGADSLEVALALEHYAEYLRSNKTRLLDAANMEARARVIRTEKRCPKCGGAIERGLVTTEGHPLLWSDETGGGIRYEILAQRCINCRHVEFFTK